MRIAPANVNKGVVGYQPASRDRGVCTMTPFQKLADRSASRSVPANRLGSTRSTTPSSLPSWSTNPHQQVRQHSKLPYSDRPSHN
jgi:hypothetical protein